MSGIAPTEAVAGDAHIPPAAEDFEKRTKDLPVEARQALSIARRIEYGRLTILLPDGRHFTFKGPHPGPEATLIVRDFAFARRLVTNGDLGFAEAFIRGEWESPDVTAFLQLFCANHALVARLLDGHPLIRWWQQFRHWLNRNTRRGAARNIHAHYDLGNAFYTSWLDRTMTYSSALFEKDAKTLEAAQTAKYRSLAEQVELADGQKVLEIGSGWGGFAEFAAKTYDIRLVGLTISPAQFDFARKRIFEAGLADKVSFRLQDYRDEKGVYDRIASIEMFEAVGERFWPAYFAQLRDRLVDGGRAGLQVITIRDEFFEDYRREMDFIQAYIFPGGMLPAPAIMKRLGEAVGLDLIQERIFGEDYARTLAAWRERFRSAWPSITTLGFDERFRRLWEYYLAYCEAGFRSGNIDVRQMVFAKTG